MLQQLPILQVLIPLAAGICSCIVTYRFSWIISLITMLICSIGAIFIFKATTINIGPIYYHLGGWANTIGIEYKIDVLSSFFILLVSLISCFNILSMKDLVNQEIEDRKRPLFYGILLISTAGLLGICSSNDIFNIYVMMEINAIAGYALVASGKNKESAHAGLNYLIFGTIGSTMVLFGIGFLYANIGSLNLEAISNAMPVALDKKSVVAGIGLMFFGILMKAALFPFGKFLVEIYHGAPSFISAILSSTSNKVAIYLLIRFFFNVFKLNQSNFDYLEIVMLFFAIFAIFYCSVKALKQNDIKRFLAYSSLSQIGFIVFALAIATKISIMGLLIYCFTHALEKTALFLAAGYLIMNLNGKGEFDGFVNIRKNFPFLCILIVINLLSNIGIPMTGGFVGKWLLLKASLATDLWCILVIIIAGIFSFTYAFKLIEIVLFKSVEEEQQQQKLFNSKTCLIGISLITLVNLYIGIRSDWVTDIASKISQIVVQ